MKNWRLPISDKFVLEIVGIGKGEVEIYFMLETFFLNGLHSLFNLKIKLSSLLFPDLFSSVNKSSKNQLSQYISLSKRKRWGLLRHFITRHFIKLPNNHTTFHHIAHGYFRFYVIMVTQNHLGSPKGEFSKRTNIKIRVFLNVIELIYCPFLEI